MNTARLKGSISFFCYDCNYYSFFINFNCKKLIVYEIITSTKENKLMKY